MSDARVIPNNEPPNAPLRWGLLVAGLAGAVLVLRTTAGSIAPTDLPTAGEGTPPWLMWWLAAVVATWFGLSLIGWLVVIRTESKPLINVIHRLSLPGVRKLAESLMAVGLVTIPAACALPAADSTPTLSQLTAAELEEMEFDGESQGGRSDLEIFGNANNAGERLASAKAPLADAIAEYRASLDLHQTAEPTPSQEVPAPITPLADAIAEFRMSAPVTATDPEQPDVTEASSNQNDDGAATSHVVEKGEHLWGIAESTLADRLGRQPSNGEIANYWRQLIQDNRDLSSGNPNLIFPGEKVRLP